MKKIIGIIAAVAMATSVFAVDFAGGMQIGGSLFTMKFADGEKPNFLKMGGLINGGFWYGSRIQTAVYADKAGCEIVLLPIQLAENNFSVDEVWRVATGMQHWNRYKLWVQPIDMLKINLGTNIEYQVYGGSEWWQKIGNNVGYTGFGFDLKPIEGLEINLGLSADKTYWIDKGVIGDWALYGKYTADFGGIGVGVIYTNNRNYLGKKAMVLSAGYNGKFDPITLAVDVGIDLFIDDTVDNKAQNLAADVFVQFNQDAIEVKFYAMYKNSLIPDASVNDANTLNLWARFQYDLGAAKVYCAVGDNGLDYIRDGFGTLINPGVNFNIGAASWDLGVKVTLDQPTANDTMTISMDVPFIVTVGF